MGIRRFGGRGAFFYVPDKIIGLRLRREWLLTAECLTSEADLAR